ncbi:MAG TPA: LuxR C-terminal-related transcriptional regulator [Gaiellaceae bacterium]|jgi:DNA-binding CsgD family transcriptional regulator|nr:LuxR C-terminal-related transcriptional regulator [Gaiellaceae bacterium]
MVVFAGAGSLLGRQRERDVLERVLEAARDAHGGVLVLHGDPGVGKTALLEHLVGIGEDFLVARTAGVEGEMELDYAALQQLCVPMLELVEPLPEPQREALEVVFGLSRGTVPSPFLVGLAVLGLLSEAAERQPLLCLVDDAQWLDGASAHALAFVARRLLAERIALVFATRDGRSSLARLPQLQIGPLGHRDARALLESALPARLDESVLERIVVETGGNPLALLELPRGLTPGQLAGGFGLPAALPLSEGIEQSFTRRLRRLSRDARRLLLLAAAEPVGDPALLRRAAERLGIPDGAAEEAESSGLFRLDGAVAFRHPLARSAVYRAADPRERREAHGALADAADQSVDPDRRAWHRAQAASAPDEALASELEESAVQAHDRGGFAAAAAFLDWSATLTPDPVRRARRMLVAAQTKFRAAALDEAVALLATTDVDALDELGRAQVELLQAQIAFASTHGGDAPRLLLEAARRIAPLSRELGCETYLEAMSAALFAGRLASPHATARDVAAAAKARLRPGELTELEALLEALASFFTDPYGVAVLRWRRALDGFETGTMPVDEQLRWKWLATLTSVHAWDDVPWHTISEAHVRIARRAGALGELPIALGQRAYAHLFAGELAAAASLIHEIEAATEATGSRLAPYAQVALAAFRGHERDAAALIDRSRMDVLDRGEGLGLSVLDWAESLLCNGLGKYEDARAAALRVIEHREDLGTTNWAAAELIEAAVRTSTPADAAGARALLAERAAASGTDWGLGILARSEALLSIDETAEALYLEAIDRLGRSRIAADLARAHLLYGEWLRRRRRRVDAREQLRTAHDLFARFGMEAFMERARVELEATGEHARRRNPSTLDQLTPQETEISRLAADGRSNREIAAQLFISPSTVEYHLRKVFRKLGVRSRTQLANHLRR